MEEILLLNKFFAIVNTCLICEDIVRQSCAMVPRWRFLATFLHPVFAASRMQHISDLHSKFALGHAMCRSMVDIQSVAAAIRRGKKEEDRKKLQGKNIMAPLLHRAAIISGHLPGPIVNGGGDRL